jgi:DNA-binding IclR family transcriptional regulator
MERSYYVTRTARALELAAQQPVTVTAVAEELRVDPRTARRLLARLAADGMLRRLDGRTRRYVAGPRLVALAVAALSHPDPGRPRTT